MGRKDNFIKLKAKLHPTVQDICWAAGIYEGEGSIQKYQLQINQKEPWILYKLKDLFGGSIHFYERAGISKKPIYRWYISGARMRGFVMTIYKFLSPHRKEQIKRKIQIG